MKEIVDARECKALNELMVSCMRDLKAKNVAGKWITVAPGLVAESCRPQLDAVHQCYTDNYSNQELYWEAKEKYLADKAEIQRTGVTKKVRDLIEQFVIDEKAIGTMTFTDRVTPGQLKYVEEMAIKHGKEDLYKSQILESRKLQKSLSGLSHDVQQCSNPFCKCREKLKKDKLQPSASSA